MREWTVGLVALLVTAVMAGPAEARSKRYKVVKAPPGKAYSHVVKLTIGPFGVGATQDREVCEYLELPMLKGLTSCLREKPGDPETCGLPIVGYDIRMKGSGTSHHFILWAYEGTAESATAFPAGIHDSKACLDFGPADSINTRQVGGSQTRKLRALLPSGLGQQVKALTGPDGMPTGIGLILNSHFIGAGQPAKGAVKIQLYVARPGSIRAYGKLIFDVLASAFIDVPPGTVRTTTGSWEVGGAVIPIVGGPPANDACVIFLTAHMHQRGLQFVTDLVDATGTQRIYETVDYSDPGQVGFIPPKLMTRGMRFQYECTHDNGVAKPQKLGCELEPGVTPGVPLWRAFLGGTLDGSPRSCASDADCTGIGTGRCVPANLVFGFTSNDDMCILPGMYYDAIPGAPPGQECDLSLLAPL